MKNTKFMSLLLAGLLMAGCGQSVTESSSKVSQSAKSSDPQTETEDMNAGQDAESMDDAIDIEGRQISAGKTELTSEAVKITTGGTYELSGTGSMIIVDATGQDVTLVLDGVTLNNDTGPGIYVKKAENVTLELKGDSSVTCGEAFDYEALNAAVYSKADLAVKGDGTLKVVTGYGHGIKAKDSAEFDASLTINAVQDGIHVNETGTFSGGSYAITAGSEGIEAKDKLEIKDGTYTVNAVDDALNAATELKISGGKLKLVSATNDAVDCNGTLEISGGDITAIAVRTPETAFDVDNTPFIISGGTIVGVGTQATMPTDASQPMLIAGGSGSVQTVTVEKDGKTILEASPDAQSNQTTLFLSCPEMKAGDTVTVTINGSSSQEVTLEEGVTTLGNVQTMGGMGRGQQGNMNGDQSPAPFEEDGASQIPSGRSGGRGNRP